MGRPIMTDKPDPELLARINEAVLSLPDIDRQIFLARRLDDLSYEQIARVTGLSVKQVERRIAKALMHIDRCVLDGGF